jgi:hypothetical protein
LKNDVTKNGKESNIKIISKTLRNSTITLLMDKKRAKKELDGPQFNWKERFERKCPGHGEDGANGVIDITKKNKPFETQKIKTELNT